MFEFSVQDRGQHGSDLDGEELYDWLGHLVAMSKNGSTIAIGAHGHDGNGSNAGHVTIISSPMKIRYNAETILMARR